MRSKEKAGDQNWAYGESQNVAHQRSGSLKTGASGGKGFATFCTPCMASGVKGVVAFSPCQALSKDANLTWLCHGVPDGPQGRRGQDPQKVPVAGQWAGSCPGCCPYGQGVFTHGRCPVSFEMTLWSSAHPSFERGRSIPTANHEVWGSPDTALGFWETPFWLI